MSNISLQESETRFDFASLTPANPEAVANFDNVSDAIRKQPSKYEHHSPFVRFGLSTGGFEGRSAGSEQSFSSDATTEIASCYGVETGAQGYYVLSLIPDHPPLRPKLGWVAGTGRWEKDPGTGEVDLLLATGRHVYPRHLILRFDRYGRLELQARHWGIELDGEPLARGSSRLVTHSHFLKIGLLLYRFAYVLPSEQETAFQIKKNDFLMTHMDLQQAPHELTSATPSVNDVKIGDWVIHGIAGVTASSVVEAASNVRTSEVVAVKRLRRWDCRSAQKTSKEVDIYEALKSVRQHKYGRFVMCIHSVLYKHGKDWPGYSDEFFLLWDPLGVATFQRFSSAGVWSNVPHDVKLRLFCQVCLGLYALHENIWMHRDIKPQNLYVVSLSPPWAVLGDFGDAVEAHESGLCPEPREHGTIGWLAPELENPLFAPKYTQAIDVWSMGAVGYFLFISSSMPWLAKKGHNIFLHRDDPAWESCKAAMSGLASNRPETLRGLLHQMLQWWPRQRIPLRGVLAHPALQDIFRSLEAESVQSTSTGSKRSAI